MKLVISSGHGKYIRGAADILDEVNEARRVVERVAEYLRSAGVGIVTFHDDVSTTQSANLNRIVNYHNSQTRDLDVSVHFNAYQHTSKPMGTEVLYVTQAQLAAKVSDAIAMAGGFINRGGKKRTDLAFLNGTSKPSILVETCFVDSQADADYYNRSFDLICRAIAEAASGVVPIDGGGEPIQPDGADTTRPTLGRGDTGPHVAEVQRVLGLPADGNFGATTEGAVKGYQAAVGLLADGIVGPNTWQQFDVLDVKMKSGNDGLAPEVIEQIKQVAKDSALAAYNWPDRGKAPIGYVQGMALSFALAQVWLADNDSTAVTMAQADRGNADTDALTWYRSEFAALGMDNSASGIDTLRHLFVLMIGLGMRESSGQYCEGRDMSASNVSADTAEAGLFQASWNLKTASPELPKLYDAYWADPNAFLPHFDDGVSPSGTDLQNYGTGQGAVYQFLAKYSPAFAAMVAGVGLRYRRQHWGPINRREVKLAREAADLLRTVQQLVAADPQPQPPEPGPLPPEPAMVTIVTTGSVRVIVNGQELVA